MHNVLSPLLEIQFFSYQIALNPGFVTIVNKAQYSAAFTVDSLPVWIDIFVVISIQAIRLQIPIAL